MGIQHRSIKALERTLAQGQPSEAALAALQQLMEDEALENLLLACARSERASLHQVFQELAAGTLKPKPNAEPNTLSAAVNELLQNSTLTQPKAIKEAHAAVLRATTQFVEIAKMAPEKQIRQTYQLEQTFQTAPAGARPFLRFVRKIAEATQRESALLRSAVVALALERYRLARGRWPDQLTDLAPAYVRAVPLDPFSGGPLRYGRLEDGVAAYSVGYDEKDDGGMVNNKEPVRPGADLGVRLWDVARRRQMPR
jgi:hypothetical protein